MGLGFNITHIINKILDVNVKNFPATQDVKLMGSNVEEQLTETDVVTGTLTFAANIKTIEIYNTDTVNNGVFNVNGIDIAVPKNDSFQANIGGTPRATVTVTGSTSYIVTRYV